MPALLMRMSRRPNFCAAPLTKARHAASVPTSACVKATLAPAVSSSAAALAALAVPIAECHARALGDETPDRRLADPRCPARYRCDPALEPSHVRHPSLHCETRIQDTSRPLIPLRRMRWNCSYSPNTAVDLGLIGRNRRDLPSARVWLKDRLPAHCKPGRLTASAFRTKSARSITPIFGRTETS